MEAELKATKKRTVEVTISTVLLIVLISGLIGAILANNRYEAGVNTRIEQTIKTGAFYHNGSVYTINPRP
jgi:hypothetical protein